jgi:LPXTG-motif cell wall-anchored protein
VAILVICTSLGVGAYAAPTDYVTSSFTWTHVLDTYPNVGDAHAKSLDFRETGLDIEGWSNSTFDDFFEVSSPVVVSWPDGYQKEVILSLDSVSEYAGTKSWSYSNYFIYGVYYGRVKARFEISGSSLSVTLGMIDSNPGNLPSEVSLRGSLASGNQTVVENVITNRVDGGFVSHGVTSRNPVIGWAENNGDELSISSHGEVVFTGSQIHPAGGSQSIYTGVRLTLLDHDPCSLPTAVDLMKDAVAYGLFSTDSSPDPVLDPNCYTFIGHTPHPVSGNSIDLRLPFESSAVLNSWSGLAPFDEEVVTRRKLGQIIGLPNGLEAEWYSIPASKEAGVRIFGTPEISSAFTVSGFTYSDDGQKLFEPLAFSFSSSDPRPVAEDSETSNESTNTPTTTPASTTTPATTTPASFTTPATTTPAARLATTGANVEWLMAAGLLVAIAGSAFLAFSRRKRIW